MSPIAVTLICVVLFGALVMMICSIGPPTDGAYTVSGGGRRTKPSGSSYIGSSGGWGTKPSVGGGQYPVHSSGLIGTGPDCVSIGGSEYSIDSHSSLTGRTIVSNTGYGEGGDQKVIDGSGNVSNYSPWDSL